MLAVTWRLHSFVIAGNEGRGGTVSSIFLRKVTEDSFLVIVDKDFNREEDAREECASPQSFL
jgi:hypothetical protein